ncbi:hypothetical protein EUGRSUZ_G03209 [Eucalyptus grandis]|uniref:Uncharacterized protein n=2 Tax=Eucalyptus grandis TaxID=71139 RepID=A0ACC3KA08_EUCGR|nr:hypothetical protein EUGRSUZ_G03209 [Eucalyptus grandis]
MYVKSHSLRGMQSKVKIELLATVKFRDLLTEKKSLEIRMTISSLCHQACDNKEKSHYRRKIKRSQIFSSSLKRDFSWH